MEKSGSFGLSQRLDDILPEQRCYTVKDIMEILMCGKVTVYDLLKKNEFRYIRHGRGAYRISKKSFDEWLDRKQEGR